MKTVIKFRLPYNVENFLTSSAPFGFIMTLFNVDCPLITFGAIVFKVSLFSFTLLKP